MIVTGRSPRGESFSLIVSDPIDGYSGVAMVGPGTIGVVYLNDDDGSEFGARMDDALGGESAPGLFASMRSAIGWLVDTRREYLRHCERPTAEIGGPR